MADPKKIRLTADLAWLAVTMRRNREVFGGWRMEADPAPAADPAAAADPAPADPPADTGKTPPWGDPENFNAEKAWELVQRLRAEKAPNADLQRQVDDLKSAQQAQIDAIAKAAGLKPDDAPADPAALAKQIADEQAKTTDAETRATNAERRLAVYVAATEHEANPSALLDSASFLTSLESIDPADAEAIGGAIKAAVEKDERFKVTPAAPSFFGGPRKTTGPTDPGPGLPRLRDAYAQSSK